MKVFLFFVLALLSRHPVDTAITYPPLIGKVIKIVDGDTYDVLLPGNITRRIRMEGIDAPERGMPFYKVSKNYLGTLCFGQTVKILETNKDRYGRTVAKTFDVKGKELGQLMVAAGFAWHFKKYSSDTKLANAELTARNKKLGLWIDAQPVAPWIYRTRKRPM